MTQMLVARRDLEPEMRRGARPGIAAHPMLPEYHPAPQHSRIYLQRLTNRLEAERMLYCRAGHDPALRIHVKHAFSRTSGHHALLINVDRVGQQRQHQALLAGQAMASRQIEVLARENLI